MNNNITNERTARRVALGRFPFPNDHVATLVRVESRVGFGAESRTVGVPIAGQLAAARQVQLGPVDCHQSGQLGSRQRGARRAAAVHGKLSFRALRHRHRFSRTFSFFLIAFG